MTKEKVLSNKEMIKRLVNNYTELKREYDKLKIEEAERVEKLKGELIKLLIDFNLDDMCRIRGMMREELDNEIIKKIDKIFGEFKEVEK